MKPTRALMRKRTPKVQLFSFSLPDRNKENAITEDSRLRNKGRKRKARGKIEDTSDDSHSSSASKRNLPLVENIQLEGSVISTEQTESEEPVLGSKSSGVFSADVQSNSDNVMKNYPDVIPEVDISIPQKTFHPSDNTTPLSDHNNKNLSHVVSKIVNHLDFAEVPEKQPELQGDPEKQPELQQDSEEQHELEVRKSSMEHPAHPVEVDHVESSVNSSTTTHRNLDPKNDLNRIKAVDKAIVLVQDIASQINLPFDSGPVRIAEATISEVPAEDSTFVADRDSPSDSDQEEIQFTDRPIQTKTFLLSGKILDKLKRKKERPILEIEIGNSKVMFGNRRTAFSTKAAKPPKQTPAIPEGRNVLFYKPTRIKRCITEVTTPEVALTVVMENFEATRKNITNNSVLPVMKAYQEAVTKDIMAVVKKMVKLKQLEKQVCKVQRYNKEKSDGIGRAIQEQMRERMRKKIRDQTEDSQALYNLCHSDYFRFEK